MDLGILVSGTIKDTLDVSLPLFLTELALAATVVLVLLCRMLPVLRWLDSGLVALGGACFAVWYGWVDLQAVQRAGAVKQGQRQGANMFSAPRRQSLTAIGVGLFERYFHKYSPLLSSLLPAYFWW